MAKIRIGFSSDFVLENSEVGIGTTNPTTKLHVAGVAKADFNITGVSTLRSYGGFIPQKQNIAIKSTTVGFATVGLQTVGVSTGYSYYETETGYTSLVGEYNTLSDDLIVDDGKIFEIKTTSITGVTTIGTQSYDYDTSRVSLGTLESVSIQSHFTLPNGGIETRPENPIEGTVRFNDDLNTLEFYNGVEWRQFTVTGASGRGILGNGQSGTILDFVQIQTLGNAQRFGDLSVERGVTASGSNSTRGIFAGGSATPVDRTEIDYITLASEGNAITFGNLSGSRTMRGLASGTCSSSTRALFAGGYTTGPSDSTNVIDYVEISTTGNALDFGDLGNDSGEGVALLATCSSPTRGIFAGGYVQSETRSSEITFLTIASKGNSVFFGDLTQKRYSIGGGSNSTRGIFAGGFNPQTNIIEYITISSSGNTQDFGDLTSNAELPVVVTDSTRAVIGCGGGNRIEYVTIHTAGNAQDFGDLTTSRYTYSGCSDSHGGLGGF